MAAPQEPKRPQSAYFVYVNATRVKVQNELGAKGFGEVTKAQAERWKTMSDAEKAPYETQASTLKTQYEKDLAAYKESGGVVGQARAEKRDAKKQKADKKAKKLSAPDMPKRPAGGAFGVWLNDHRAEIMKTLPAGSKATAVAPVASAKWKALSEQEKEPYQKRYDEKSEKYKEEMKAWKDANPEVASETPEEASESPKKVAGKKRGKPEAEDATKSDLPLPPQKKAKGRGRRAVTAAPCNSEIDANVLKKASELGFEVSLKNLAAREGMERFSAEKMLSVLQESGGLVNKAKAALLAGAGA